MLTPIYELVDEFPPSTARSFIEVMWTRHYRNPQELRGKTILDLGCGKSNLQAGIDDQGIDAFVIGVDFKALKLAREHESLGKNKINAELAALPVASESIDVVLATHSLPQYARSSDELRNFFVECKRVVKVGGILSISPLYVVEQPDGTLADLEASEAELDVQLDAIACSPDWIDCRERKNYDHLLTVMKLTSTL